MVEMRSSRTLALWQRQQEASNHKYISQPTQHTNCSHRTIQSKWMVQADQQSLPLL